MKAERVSYRFPDGFLWGSCVSDYQTFGGSECDLPCRWGVRHVDRYPEDFELISGDLHHNALRTAIEWSRIEPKEGKINKDAISFYHNYFESLRKTGMKTFVSLHDFSNPMWVQEQGGWLSKKIVDKFSQFIELVAREFGRYIDYCIIINDPAVVALNSYFAGTSPDRGLPPFHNDFTEAFTCLSNFTTAIVEGSEILHKDTKAKVGLSNFYGAFTPLDSKNRRQLDSAEFASQVLTYQVPDTTRKKVDFMGIRYYVKVVMTEDYKAAGGEIHPKGIRESAKDYYKRYNLPIVIIENGFPTRDDDEKTKFLLEHLKELHNAINIDKVNVIGYNWWCTIHSIEWGYGFKPFFALVDVEGEEKDIGGYEDLAGSLKRRITKTGERYGTICRDNGFSQSDYEEYHAMSKPFRHWQEY